MDGLSRQPIPVSDSRASNTEVVLPEFKTLFEVVGHTHSVFYDADHLKRQFNDQLAGPLAEDAARTWPSLRPPTLRAGVRLATARTTRT